MRRDEKSMEYKLGQIVYHREVYSHKEALKIVGIRKNELELEGDYSGGTHNVIEKQWMPLKGVSRIYNHKYKQECRDAAVTIQELAKPITDRTKDNMTKTMFDLLDMVFVLTNDVSLNPEETLNSEWDGRCKCGHLHSEHNPINSHNYSAGHCQIGECRCKHFINSLP